MTTSPPLAREPPTRKTQPKTPGGFRARSPRWLLPVAIIALALLGIGTWWVSTRVNDGTDGAAVPIVTFTTPDFHSLLIDPANADRILFGSHAGIQESQDGGLTWQHGSLRDTDAMQLTVSPMSSQTIYATGHDVFQVSFDSGTTWQSQAHDLPRTDIHGFAQDPSDPRRLYAYVVGVGIFTSRDGGTSWQEVPTQPTSGGVLAAGPGVLYTGSGPTIIVSRDGGLSWQDLTTLASGQVISLAVSASEPQVLYAGTPTGVTRSTDGGERWEDLGPTGGPILALAVSSSQPQLVLAVGNDGGLYWSEDGGETWQ